MSAMHPQGRQDYLEGAQPALIWSKVSIRTKHTTPSITERSQDALAKMVRLTRTTASRKVEASGNGEDAVIWLHPM